MIAYINYTPMYVHIIQKQQHTTNKGHPFISTEFFCIFRWDSQTNQTEGAKWLWSPASARGPGINWWWKSWGEMFTTQNREMMTSVRWFWIFLRKKKRGVFHLEPEPPFFWQNHSEEFDSRISHKWIACYYQAGEVSLLVDLMSWQFTNIQTIILKPS